MVGVQQNVRGNMYCIRLTRHEATTEQVSALCRIYDLTPQNIYTIAITLAQDVDIKELVAEFDRLVGDAEVVEVVLPIHLIEAILKTSEWIKRPSSSLLRAVMRRNTNSDGQVEFIFDHYERIVSVDIVTEIL